MGVCMFTDLLVEYRRLLVGLVAVASLALMPFVLKLELDRTLKSAYVTSSPAYAQYKDFQSVFGDDEFILVAIKSTKGVDDPVFLKALSEITAKLEAFPEVVEVTSLTNLKVFQKRNERLGSYPLVVADQAILRVPDKEQVARIRIGLPMIDFLLSRDLLTAGLVVKVHDRWKFDPDMGKLQQRIAGAVKDALPPGAEFRMTGPAVIREAVQDITVSTAIRYGILCTIVITLVCLYIFKSLRVAAITLGVIGTAVYWVLGLMSLIGVQLNSTTSLTFGLVLVVSVAVVIHIVTRYYEDSESASDRVEGVKRALRAVGRPCLMCSLTTAVAFATIMISTIPMVQQLGLVMALGVLVAFVLAVILTPAFLVWFSPVDVRVQDKMADDRISKVIVRVERFVFERYKLSTILGIVFSVLMIASAPFIIIDTQILRLFVDSSPVLSDIRFVEKNLTPVRTLEVVVEADDQALKKIDAWRKVADFQRRLKEIPQIANVDSPLLLLEYLHEMLSKTGSDPARLLEEQAVLSQMLAVTTFSSDGKKLLRKYLDSRSGKVHLTLTLSHGDPTPISQTIGKIQEVGDEAMKGFGRVVVTGEQAVFAAQASEVVASQVWSVILALIGVTILMIIQLRSVPLGLISLIPNIPPVLVIFGMMGILGIPLDNVTVFAAAIAIGLSVDDTIHYLTHLKKDMAASGSESPDIVQCMKDTYQSTSRGIVSTSLTLLFGFLMLSLTPTLPAIYFGFLGAAAVVVALWGDLMFMPSVILTFPWLQRVLNREIRAHAEAAPA